MPVFKTFFLIAKKYMTTATIYAVIFIGLCVSLTSNAQETNDANFKASSISICVFDNDKTPASKALVDYLGARHKLTTNLNNVDDSFLQDSLYYHKFEYIFTIKEGYEENLQSGNLENIVSHSTLMDNMSTIYATQQIDRYIASVHMYLTGGFSMEESLKKASSLYEDSDYVTSKNFDNVVDDSKNVDMFYYFQYFPYILISILLFCVSPIIISFNKSDINKRIVASSIKPLSKNIQLLSATIIYSIVIWLLFMIVCALIYSPANFFSKNGLMCCANSFVFTLFTISLTLFISCFNLKSNVISMISNIVGLGMSFLCGIFVPQMYLGDAVLSVSRFLPAYWYIRNNDMLSGMSSEIMSNQTYITCIGIQLIFCLAFIMLFVVFSRQRKTA